MGSTPGRSTSMEQPWASSHTCASVSPSSIIRYQPKGGDALCLEGSRRSGVPLAMHHILSGIAAYGLNGLEKGDEHPVPVAWQFAFT